MASPLSGGEKLERYLAQLHMKLGRKDELSVGFLEGAAYPDGTPIAMVAAVNEYGRPSIGQPPRPAFRRMIAKEQGHWAKDLARILVQTNYNVPQSFGIMGAQIAGELKQSIIDFKDPPIKPATAAAKGFDKPLIDSRDMLHSVDFQVK